MLLTFILRRILDTIPVMLGATLLVFTVMQFVPGDPVLLLLGDHASAAEVARVRQELGLDQPLVIQYLRWLWGVVRGDFGRALIDGVPVLPSLLARLPATITLLCAAMVVSLLIAVPAGVISAIWRGTWIDSVVRMIALLGVSFPSVWLALLFILVFSLWLRVLPASGAGTIRHLVLPAITLGSGMAAIVMRMVRSAMLEVLQEDYVRTARAKGLAGWAVIIRHVFRNALIPLITVVGLQAGYLLSGSVVVESVFSWPGIGLYAFQRIVTRDYPMIMGCLFLFAMMYAFVNLVTDILYATVDPRIRME